MNETSAKRPHSEEYFGDDRDLYWNEDYLALLGSRLNLDQIQTVADIGCGIGHWTKALLPQLSSDLTVTAIDFEPEHVRRYNDKLRPLLLSTQSACAFQGDAYALPLQDNHVELATCQTLLLHLQHPLRAIEEMVRITRPGGLVLCVEPTNLIARLPLGNSIGVEPIERILRLSELSWRYVIGRARLGKGSELIGESLPGLLQEAGLENIQVWLVDKAHASLPPYDTAEDVLSSQADEQHRAAGTGLYDRQEYRENVLAGGGDDAFFDLAWNDLMQREAELQARRLAGTWSDPGGNLFYVAAGRKPV